MKFRLEAVVEIDDTMFDLNDADEREWFWNLLAAENGMEPIILHSNEVGDSIGTVVFPREAVREG